ncbi:speckle-type POZ protein B-like isoform X2 [Venturia canescens]|nr:speckle-type POZ protein B-like isoform X2 [Venturia canescens]XP_043274923.1 speckle-type POZ protein B-like isoform X2 [Venturia canescens]XP_043274924.1 speckle-type POZ protein B-like isoform X2 [Venturia canescens]
MELLVPTVSDIVFKYSWPIEHYKKTIAKSSLIDSLPFDVNVNGIRSSWNLSIRFWKGPEGKRITNPVVLCLNMLSCTVEEIEQATIRFQFAIYNSELDHWEYCQVSRTIIELKSTSDIISLGYRDLSIVDRHIKKSGEVLVMVKIQIIQYEIEKHSLSQDMARLLKHPRAADTKLICGGTSGTEIPVHGSVIAARSNILADMMVPLAEKETEKKAQAEAASKSETRDEKEDKREENGVADVPYKYALQLEDISPDIMQELLRYIYSDRVDNLDAIANQLLSLAERFQLQGLKEACERNLIESITPENVANLLLMSDEFGCGSLKRASIVYCEEHAMNISKSFAWKVMEHVNPELFNEVCEGGMGSSRSSNIDDSELSN